MAAIAQGCVRLCVLGSSRATMCDLTAGTCDQCRIRRCSRSLSRAERRVDRIGLRLLRLMMVAGMPRRDAVARARFGRTAGMVRGLDELGCGRDCGRRRMVLGSRPLG